MHAYGRGRESFRRAKRSCPSAAGDGCSPMHEYVHVNIHVYMHACMHACALSHTCAAANIHCHTQFRWNRARAKERAREAVAGALHVPRECSVRGGRRGCGQRHEPHHYRHRRQRHACWAGQWPRTVPRLFLHDPYKNLMRIVIDQKFNILLV